MPSKARPTMLAFPNNNNVGGWPGYDSRVHWKKVQDKGQEAPCREKPLGEVRARTCGTKSPSRSEALHFIDSSKSPSTKIDGSLVNLGAGFNRHGRPRRMLIWTFEGNTDQTVSTSTWFAQVGSSVLARSLAQRNASLEPGPSRAGYFPRDMLRLTTTARVPGRAVAVNSNMSRGKYLAREGPGSRLSEMRLTVVPRLGVRLASSNKVAGQRVR